MTLKQLFDKYKIEGDVLQFRIAYILAYYEALETQEGEQVAECDLTCYDWEELNTTEYDLIAGAYHNGVWLSLEGIIKALRKCEKYYF